MDWIVIGLLWWLLTKKKQFTNRRYLLIPSRTNFFISFQDFLCYYLPSQKQKKQTNIATYLVLYNNHSIIIFLFVNHYFFSLPNESTVWYMIFNVRLSNRYDRCLIAVNIFQNTCSFYNNYVTQRFQNK
jgi:hypothetical protein